MDPLLFRSIERIVSVLIGGLSIFLGYRLFSSVRGQSDGKALVTIADVEAFKQAGGYNDDRNMCYLLASLFTARHREWLGTSLAERSITE